MLCSDVMTRDPTMVVAADPIQRAAENMRNFNTGFLPVVDLDKHPQGTITDRDIVVRGVAQGSDASRPVSECMSTGVYSCRPDDDLERALELMSEHKIERVIITDYQDRVVGVISLSDLAQLAYSQEAADAFKSITDREAPSL